MEPVRRQGFAVIVMPRISFNFMSLTINVRQWPRVLGLGLLLALPPVFAADLPAPGASEVIVSTTPMALETENVGAHGQFVVAPEILSADTRADLVYTISAEPQYGRVGLAGGGKAEGTARGV